MIIVMPVALVVAISHAPDFLHDNEMSAMSHCESLQAHLQATSQSPSGMTLVNNIGNCMDWHEDISYGMKFVVDSKQAIISGQQSPLSGPDRGALADPKR
jgi:hypothetical protein